MWHEARKQERKIRGMIVDFKRRAERRQDFYEKIKADPTQFMQIHGRKCQIHLDPAVAMAGDAANIIVPWQGQKDNLIDRFDVRAHLDHISPSAKSKELEETLSLEERQCNYERYRILAQNDFLGITEDKYLHQLYMEEQYGASVHQDAFVNNSTNHKKKNTGVAIGYTYEDSEPAVPFTHVGSQIQQTTEEDSEDSNSDIDMDVSIEISKLDTNQAHELNGCGRNYGMISNDYYSYLNADFDEADALRMAKEEEHEKMMLSGRKSRRERRAQRERRFAGRPTLSPPSYAAKEDPVLDSKENESANSRSPSPENTGKITYITSFGGEDELQPHTKIMININKPPSKGGQSVTYADKVKENLEKLKRLNEEQVRKFKGSESPKIPKQYLRSRSRSSYKRRSRSRDRRTSRCRDYRRESSRRVYRNKTRSRSRSPSYSRYKRSRSRSPSYRRRRYSRSPVRMKTRRRSFSSSSSSSASSKSANNIENKKCFKLPEILSDLTKSNQNKVLVNPQLEKESERFENLIKNLQFDSTPPPPPPPPEEIKPEIKIKEEPPPMKRYYGRKRENASSSSESDASSDKKDNNENSNSDKSNITQLKVINPLTTSQHLSSGSTNNSSNLSNFGKTLTTSIETTKIGASSSASSKNLRERLKRKMQILLNKQYKADKQAEIERTERQIQQQEEREYEMRELALRLRRRNRELRHKYGSPSQSSQSSDENPDKNTEEAIKQILGETRKSKSRSKTRSRTRSRERTRRIRDSSRTDRYTRRRSRSNDRRKRSTSRDHRRGSSRSSRRKLSRSRSPMASYNRRRRSPSRRPYHDRRSRDRRSRSRDRSRSNSKGKRKVLPKIKSIKKLVDY